VVVDLSAKTEAEAVALRAERGAMCVLLRRDAQGRALFRDPAEPPWHGGRLLEWLRWRELAAASAAALSLAACGASERCHEPAPATDEAVVERSPEPSMLPDSVVKDVVSPVEEPSEFIDISKMKDMNISLGSIALDGPSPRPPVKRYDK
jgi:hypothetical protein